MPRLFQNRRLSLLQIEGDLSPRSYNLLTSTWMALPLNVSSSIQVSFLPELTASRGKLLSLAGRGTPVHAAAFIRRRQVVLEGELLAQIPALRFIFIHEIFHFAWARLGNGQRDQFSELLLAELRANARGELGESSALKKDEVQRQASPLSRRALWRDYVCESFCDSAASLLGLGPVHDGVILGKSRTAIRKRWFVGPGPVGRIWSV